MRTSLNNTNPLWDDDLIQFARLLCEINATVDISGPTWDDLCASMDLESEDVEQLFERAHYRWEWQKEKLDN